MTYQPGDKIRLRGRMGKIRSLPSEIRAEVNRRFDDGDTMKEVAEWLNSQEEVRKVLDEKWQGRPVEMQSVQSWRERDYPIWLRKREQVENLKELSEYALKLGQAAGGSIADGSAAIVGGRIMAAIETASDEDMFKMVRAISELRAGDINRVRLEQNDKKLAQSEQRLAQHQQKLELERQRFQRQTTELFLKWYDDKRAREIVESRDGNAEKIELLGRAMFGEAWRC